MLHSYVVLFLSEPVQRLYSLLSFTLTSDLSCQMLHSYAVLSLSKPIQRPIQTNSKALLSWRGPTAEPRHPPAWPYPFLNTKWRWYHNPRGETLSRLKDLSRLSGLSLSTLLVKKHWWGPHHHWQRLASPITWWWLRLSKARDISPN